MEDKLELVAAGDALTLAPAGDEHSSLRRDLTIVPVHGVEPCRVVIATRAGETGRMIDDFRAVAAALLTPA
jgi:hypothetical protein